MKIKTLVIILGVFVLVGGSVTFYEISARQERNSTYREIIYAIDRHDYETVMRLSDIFVDNPSRFFDDRRAEQVRGYRKDAERAQAKEKDESAKAQIRTQAYSAILQADTNQAHSDILAVAGQFLENLPSGDADEREQVVRALREAAKTALEIQIDAYQQLISAFQGGDYEVVFDNAIRYLEYSSPDTHAERDRQVIDLYSRAMFDWFMRIEGELTTEQMGHIRQFEEMAVKFGISKGDSQ